MKTERIKDWEIKKEHPCLPTQDLAYEVGKEEELLERLQKKMSKNKNEITKWLSLMDSFGQQYYFV